MMYPREAAISILESTVATIQSEATSDLDRAVAVRELRKSTTDPRFEAVWKEAGEYLALTTVSKGTAGAGLTLKSVTEGEGAGGVWLPRWTTPVGSQRGYKLAMALLAYMGYAAKTDANTGTITLTLVKVNEGWVPQTVGEQLVRNKR